MDEIRKVKDALTEPLLEMGYTLYNVKLQKGKNGLTLEIVVDRDDPISLDDIVKVSDLINPILDEKDPIEGPYTLDVSSLGSEKPIALGKLEKYVNRYIHLHLSHPYQGLNDLEGKLLVALPDSIELEIREKSRKKAIKIARDTIDNARLAIEF